jgi:hypothetical protein
MRLVDSLLAVAPGSSNAGWSRTFHRQFQYPPLHHHWLFLSVLCLVTKLSILAKPRDFKIGKAEIPGRKLCERPTAR